MSDSARHSGTHPLPGAGATTLFLRRPRPGANHSIERSFGAVQAAYAEQGLAAPRWYVFSHYSTGLWPRLRLCAEVWRQRNLVNHVSGDVHFVALALPGRRTILTIHDCAFMHHYRGWRRALLGLLWLRWPVRHCRYVTTVSEATRQEVIRFTGCDPAKVQVIPTVISPDFRAVPRPFAAGGRVRVLHIGGAPHKNLDRHLEALAGLPVQVHIVAPLRPHQLERLRSLGLDYLHTPNLSAEAVRQAYENCDLLLFASTLEGFGMPILEAQTVGRPVVTSRLSSMPEVAGGAACLVDPYDVADIRAGLCRLIDDAAYREELVKKGFKNIERFQARAVALRYAALYTTILQDQKS